MKTRLIIFSIGLFLLAACKPEIEEFSVSKGNADFTTYVALGSSLSAGYADGELYKTGQEYSIPNLLAQQLQLAGGGSFNQPLMLDDLGFGQKRVLALKADCKGVVSLMPVLATGTPDPGNFASIYSTKGPFHNISVPGTKSFMATKTGYGQLNPYFGRFASGDGASMLGDAIASQPTFYTLWLGLNDILNYASKGGETGGDSITPIAIFNMSIAGALEALAETGANGAIINIPDVVSMPYCTTVPAKGLAIDAATALLLNAAYQNYNAGAAAFGLPKIEFSEGANYWVIQDRSIPDQLGNIRQMKEGELLLLSVPQDSLKCANWGSAKRIPDYYVLDAAEIQKINNAVNAFNASLAGFADANGLALVDMYTFLKSFSAGLVFDGVQMNTTFVTGGLYSLDGVHLNPRGNAAATNFIIETINSYFGASVPKVNVSLYPGIRFP